MSSEPGRRRAGRPAAGREPLTRELILATALRLVDERGLAALSMRRLAAALGVDPMAIYHHLPGKGAVVEGLVRLVFAELRLPPGAGSPWQARVRAFAGAYRDLARAHAPLLLPLVSDAALTAAATLTACEELYAALEAAGLPPVAIVGAADLMIDYIHGFVLAEAATAPGQLDNGRELLAHLAARPPDELPAMRRVFGALALAELPASFDFGLDVIVAGIEAIAGAGSTPKAG